MEGATSSVRFSKKERERGRYNDVELFLGQPMDIVVRWCRKGAQPVWQRLMGSRTQRVGPRCHMVEVEFKNRRALVTSLKLFQRKLELAIRVLH